MSVTAETRYTRTSDGVHIAYRVIGEGPIDMVLVLGAATHIEHELTEPSIARWAEGLGSFARLIRFDKRGAGLSDRAVGAPTLEERMEDVRAVMDAAGTQRAVIFGASEGGSLACLFAATYPERTAALVLYGAVVKWYATPDFPWSHTAETLDWMLEQGEATFGQGPPLEFWAPSMAGDVQAKKWWGDHERLASSPGSARAMMELNRATDIRAILPTINAPCLILHRKDDAIVSVEQGRYLARTIPGAKYVELDGADHLPFYGDTNAIVDEIEEFVTGARHEREIDRVLATVLFTDVVGSTARAAELGDRRWRELLSLHNGVVRTQLERFRGHEVNTAGDGFLATFDGPARAIRCAAAIRDAVVPLGLSVRAGLHTGELEMMGDDIAGIAVHIGARVGAMAQANEVLVSRTVADLVAGSGIVFEDRGTHQLKGVPGEWQLFAVTPG